MTLVLQKPRISLIVDLINNHLFLAVSSTTTAQPCSYVRKNVRELLHTHDFAASSQSHILLRISAKVLIINLVGVVGSSLIFMSLRTTLVFMLTGIATAVIAILPVMVSIKRKPLIMQIKEEK